MTDTPMRVVSGIQPPATSPGNLLRSILRWVRMQEETECLSSLRSSRPDGRRQSGYPARQRARNGRRADRQRIDPDKSTLFAQARARPRRTAGSPVHRPHVCSTIRSSRRISKNRKARASACSPIRCSSGRRAAVSRDARPRRRPEAAIELARDNRDEVNNDFDTDLFVAPEPYIGGGPQPA